MGFVYSCQVCTLLSRFLMKKLILLSSILGLSACGSTGMNLSPYKDAAATPEKFYVCHGYGCTHKTWAGFSAAEWAQIKGIFRVKAKDSAAERVQIGKAIAMMEKYAGARSGTAGDLGEARTRKEDENQMDCIDETINTDQYLQFLDQEGLFTFHRHTKPAHRGYFVDGQWPHNTAAVRENASGRVWVVDSYYFANGHVPSIVPLEEWFKGWKPPEIIEQRKKKP